MYWSNLRQNLRPMETRLLFTNKKSNLHCCVLPKTLSFVNLEQGILNADLVNTIVFFFKKIDISLKLLQERSFLNYYSHYILLYGTIIVIIESCTGVREIYVNILQTNNWKRSRYG